MKVLFFFKAPSCDFRAKRESFATCMASEKNAYFSRVSQVLHLFLPESSLQVFCLSTPVFLTYVQTGAVLQCGTAGKYNM